MSGVVGHTLFAVLGAKAAAARGLVIADLAQRHWASYLCGAYLGCDIQTMPEAICSETGKEVGYGTVPLTRSPITGGPVTPWFLKHDGQSYRPKQIHEWFYGRSHFVFGWTRAETQLAIPWDHLPDYFSLLLQDARELFGPGERQIAYLFGWLAHVVSDSLIKSIVPGLTLHLLDGMYTSKNRPIQDVFCYHIIGRRELRLDWSALLSDMGDTIIEPLQHHGMRVANPRGLLARDFADGWAPEKAKLLSAVLAENHRYLKTYVQDVQRELALVEVNGDWECSESLRKLSGGLSYREMIALAEESRYRFTLWQMGQAIADMFQAVTERTPQILEKGTPNPTWEVLTEKWRR